MTVVPIVVHKSRRPGRSKIVLVVVLALVPIAVIVGLLAHATPGWWSENPPKGEEALVVSRALEQGIASQMTLVRGPGAQPWRVSVHTEDINAWLNARLPQWLEHDRSLPWPKDVLMPQVRIGTDGIEAAAPWHGWIVASSWTVVPGADGTAARLVPTTARIGRLTVPFGSGLGDWFVPELTAPVPLETKLGDGRLVRVTNVTFTDGLAVLDCATVAN